MLKTAAAATTTTLKAVVVLLQQLCSAFYDVEIRPPLKYVPMDIAFFISTDHTIGTWVLMFCVICEAMVLKIL